MTTPEQNRRARERALQKVREIPLSKSCSRCGEEKPSSDFYVDRRYKDGLTSRCRPCNLEYGKEFRERTPGRAYGLTPEQHRALWEKQGGVCAICKQDETAIHNISRNRIKQLSVDHDHETGMVRGLLCQRCNRAIGLLQESAEVLAVALDYLIHPPHQASDPILKEFRGG